MRQTKHPRHSRIIRKWDGTILAEGHEVSRGLSESDRPNPQLMIRDHQSEGAGLDTLEFECEPQTAASTENPQAKD